MNQSPSKSGESALVSMAAFVVIVAGLRAAQAIVVPFLVAAFLTLLSLPALHWFERRRLPIWLALLVITVFVVLIALVLAAVIASSVNELRLQLPAYQERVTTLRASMDDWMKQHGVTAGLALDPEFSSTGRVLSLFGNLLGALGSLLNNALIIVFTLVFMQLEASSFPTKLRAIRSESSDASTALERIRTSVWRYVRLKTRVSLLTGVLMVLWLWFLGVHFPVLWGLLALLFNFVPTIGPIIAAVPAILVAALQPDVAGQPVSVAESLYLAGYAALGYLVVSLIIGNVVEPRLMGSGVGLSTLVVFLSLIFWGWVLGAVGMVLSVPLTMIVKIVLDNSEDLRWVGILLGPEVPTGPSTKPP